MGCVRMIERLKHGLLLCAVIIKVVRMGGDVQALHHIAIFDDP